MEMDTGTPLHDRLLVLAESSPWSALYRIAVGYAIVPLYATLLGRDEGWGLVAWFVAILAVVRVSCMVLRRLLPFSKRVESVWSARRALAKRFDSYQWQKLTWFGVGMLIQAAAAGRASVAVAALIAFCLVGGVLGALAWRRNKPPLPSLSVETRVGG